MAGDETWIRQRAHTGRNDRTPQMPGLGTDESYNIPKYDCTEYDPSLKPLSPKSWNVKVDEREHSGIFL